MYHCQGLRQIGDVVLVHDESSLLDPPADESLGFVRMIGSEVLHRGRPDAGESERFPLQS